MSEQFVLHLCLLEEYRSGEKASVIRKSNNTELRSDTYCFHMYILFVVQPRINYYEVLRNIQFRTMLPERPVAFLIFQSCLHHKHNYIHLSCIWVKAEIHKTVSNQE